MTVSLTTLVSFNGADGIGPASNLIANSNGDLFGTTEGGGGTPGTFGYGYGVRDRQQRHRCRPELCERRHHDSHLQRRRWRRAARRADRRCQG